MKMSTHKLLELNTNYRNKVFKESIKNACTVKGLSIEKLAEKMGINTRTVYNHLNSPSSVKPKQLEQYNKILDIKKSIELIYDADEFIENHIIRENIMEKCNQFSPIFKKQCIYMLYKGFETYIKITPSQWCFLCEYSSLTIEQKLVIKRVLKNLKRDRKYELSSSQINFIQDIKKIRTSSVRDKPYKEQYTFVKALERQLNMCRGYQLDNFYQRLEYLPYITYEEWNILIDYITVSSHSESQVLNYLCIEFVKINLSKNHYIPCKRKINNIKITKKEEVLL